MYPLVEGSPEFERLVAGHADADLARVALEIARDVDPDVDPARATRRLDDLARRVSRRLDRSAERWLSLEALRHVLFVDHEFELDDLEGLEPRSCDLTDTLEHRVGTPLTLSIVGQAVGRRVGLPLQIAASNQRLLLKCETSDGDVYIDPARAGALAQVSRSPKPYSQADLTVRLLKTLKALLIRQRRFSASIPVMKRLAALSPHNPSELRDLGIICFYEQRRRESVGYLAEYLKAAPTADDAEEIRFLLRAAGF